MEGMNHQILDMIDELEQRAYRMHSGKKAEKEADEYGYPFEPFDMFSAEPLGFLETAMRLETEMTELFSLGCRLNRHSPMFAKVSGQMERMIRQLGSCCITKAILEQQGQQFPLLEQVTIDWLRRMTAFNFRKCCAAFMDAHEAGSWNLGSSDLSLRWSALDKRLLATAEKIEMIRSGEIKPDLSQPSMGKDTDAVSRGVAAVSGTDEKVTAFTEKVSALPIDKAAARKMMEQESPAQDADVQAVPQQKETAVQPAAEEPAAAVLRRTGDSNTGNTAEDILSFEDLCEDVDAYEDDVDALFTSGSPEIPEWLIRRMIDN